MAGRSDRSLLVDWKEEGRRERFLLAAQLWLKHHAPQAGSYLTAIKLLLQLATQKNKSAAMP